MTENRYEYGCGEHKTPGYIGVDMVPTNIQFSSIKQIFNPVCEPGAAQEILSIHFIEHFTRPDVQRLVEMWFTMLCYGGQLIACFPDMAAMSADMMASVDSRVRSMSRRPLDHVFSGIVLSDVNKLFVHRSFWTAQEFIDLLLEVGFPEVEQVNYHRPRHDRVWTSEVRGVK